MVLDRPHRLTRSADFTRATRSGRRAGTRTLVVYAHPAEGDEQARVGFVVGRAVGVAVVRNRVKRRLRHLVRARLAAGDLPPALLVVRALPPAAGATYDRLGADLDVALARLTGDRPTGRSTGQSTGRSA